MTSLDQFNDKNRQRGFTLVEVLLIVALLLVLFLGMSPVFVDLFGTAQLDDTTSQIAQTLRIARERSAARYNNAQHGVYFNVNPIGDDSVVLFQGSSYAARNSIYDRVIPFDAGVAITTDFTGDEVVFSRGAGRPNIAGTTRTVNVQHAVEGSGSITVNVLGRVDES